jgi:OOP family OmpA-OmpF porin
MAEVVARGSSRAAAAEDDETFAELRTLLVGPERQELHELQAHVLDPTVQTQDISRVLPDAIALRSEDPQLMRALAPSVEEAITSSVRRDPRPLADALFPVIGPAIRKAIAHTLTGMIESLNRTLEQSVSFRALHWRWEALRTGKPFAEVVLLHTLQYRVEQVFLIHAETGLLLQHLSADAHASQDADQISAMLTAIRDFARDSFRVGGHEGLEGLHVGDLVVIIEQGPHAILAGVVRGTPPHAVRVTFQDALESVHRQMAPELRAFRGDAAPFEMVRPLLEACLVSQFRGMEQPRSPRRWIIAGAVVLLALGAWWSFGYVQSRRWNDYLTRLRAEPGLVVVSQGRESGKFVVTGLRDPLARDPASLVSASNLSPDAVEGRWEPYEAIQPAFVVARGQDLLRPPAGVTLSYRDGTLTASGPASDRWIVDSERLAPALQGVRRFAYAGQSPEARLTQALSSVALLFPKGESFLDAGQDPAIADALRSLTALNDLATLRGRIYRVDVVGHADTDGPNELNSPLSAARAEAVMRMLPMDRLGALTFTPVGVGIAEPLASGSTEVEKTQNRRVSFHVHADAPTQDTRR